MTTDNSVSSILMPKKRERFEKGKRLNAHTYKKLFQIAGQKMKEASQGGDHIITKSDASKEIDETLVMKSCSDPKHERHRVALDPEEICFGNPESANKHPQMDCGECVTTLKTGPTCSAELSEFPFEVSTEIHDHVLPYVNKLRAYWHRGQNSVFFDGQDRIIKVVFFVLSLLDNVNHPILIITPSSSLSLWENEFSKWSNNSTNILTYKENKEFYIENGCIKFQVLLSSPDAILEDFEMLDHIKWELIVIDECQLPTISKIFSKIKMLTVDMKLLAVTSEIVEVRQTYQSILSLIDSKYEEEIHTDNTLKERLSHFVAFECNVSNSPEIEEYWVPVHLSHVQIKQYCSLLNSNSETLSSCFKNTSSLHDILAQTQKCCDHPYLVDPMLRESLKADVGDSDEELEVEISVSGKLQLLDKLLLQIKQCGLRVLVLFQSVVSSEKITIGDILEDLVDRRFDQDSYVRIQPKILSKSKRKEAVNMFNNIESGTFICLLDYHDCQSALALSSVNVVILFNSNWNPLNDLKDLHKLTLDPHSNPLKFFRFYSPFTIEEKSLILSKHGTNRINYNICHRLLAWGASYLFNSLSKDPELKSKSKSDDLVNELSTLLVNRNGNKLKSSIVSNAEMCDGVYCKDILLRGESENEENVKESFSIEEYLMENGPNLFWSNLFKESQPVDTRGDSSSRSARRVKLSFRNPYYWFGQYEEESESDMEKFNKNVITKKSRSKRKSRYRYKSKVTGVQMQLPRAPFPSISSTSHVAECTNNQPQQPPPVNDQSSITTPLVTELENIKKEQEQATKLHQEKKSMLLSECEKEVSEICAKYDALIEDSEACLTKKMKVLEGYYDLVYANKVLADTLTQKCNDDKEARSLRIVEIPASALVHSQKRCTSATSMPSLRAPAPHLRSSSSLFASFNKLPKMQVLDSDNAT